ncbi:MAG: ATP-dependent helicase HrpB, partial [Acidobacteriota bacterium]
MALPIDDLLPAIVAALGSNDSIVIEAAPGAGKTTRVPPALLDVVRGDVIVLEPRRLAARLAARRVASELGEKLGETVGYQVRFEDVTGPRTKLRFLTEGVLTRRMLSDPDLKSTSVVILDEFHERHLESDLALALLRRLQKTSRPDLKLVVMSATLDAAPIAKYLNDCPVFTSATRQHPLEIEYTPHSALALEESVAQAVERLLNSQHTGDTLVFLPGAAEIRKATRALERIAARAGLLVLPLHGDLPTTEQDRAVARADRPKVILSTNVAESSVTIEGVTAVIDSGLARVASDSPWTGLPSVEVRRISKSSAIQRAGRAARTGPGRAIRLYTADEFHRRPQADIPEIHRRELSQLVLHLRAMKTSPDMQWLDPPPQAAMDAANALLDKLNVTSEMAELPLPPRLAKLVLEAQRHGVPGKGCAVATVLSAGERGGADSRTADVLELAEGTWQPQTQRVYDQLRKRIRGQDIAGKSRAEVDARVRQSILAAFPDRVARRRKDGELLLSGGGSAKLPGCRWEFLVAVDIEERKEHGAPLVRLAVPIEPEWLLDRAVERITLDWNRSAERVEQVSALLYDQLVIEETRAPAIPGEETARLLSQKALEAGVERFADRDALQHMVDRAKFAGVTLDPEAKLIELCQNAASFADLRAADLLNTLRPSRMEQAAPDRLRLASGRQVQIHYEPGKPPWIESRLQDFFGMKETPKINGVPMVVHLLAPNQRPVQVTSDLAGFWERLYPQVRKELMRR